MLLRRDDEPVASPNRDAGAETLTADDGSVTVIARYAARPESADTVAGVLARHAVQSRAEPGCIRFDVYRGIDDRNSFVLVERYVDEEAFTAHRRTAHFIGNIEHTIAPLLTERMWQRCEEI